MFRCIWYIICKFYRMKIKKQETRGWSLAFLHILIMTCDDEKFIPDIGSNYLLDK